MRTMATSRNTSDKVKVHSTTIRSCWSCEKAEICTSQQKRALARMRIDLPGRTKARSQQERNAESPWWVAQMEIVCDGGVE